MNIPKLPQSKKFEPGFLSLHDRAPAAKHCFNKNRWSAAWLRSLLFKVFPSHSSSTLLFTELIILRKFALAPNIPRTLGNFPAHLPLKIPQNLTFTSATFLKPCLCNWKYKQCCDWAWSPVARVHKGLASSCWKTIAVYRARQTSKVSNPLSSMIFSSEHNFHLTLPMLKSNMQMSSNIK